MDFEKGINSEKESIDIQPLKKGKRILVFLADFFLCYILTFVIFNVASAPIGKAVTSYDEKEDSYIEASREMFNHYYQTKLFFEDESFDKYDGTLAMEYTYDCWLSYYVLNSESSIDPNHLQYGHKMENETIYHFYNDIKNNKDDYYSLFDSYNEKHSYFVFDEATKIYSLKEDVKNELYAYFDPKDEMGDVGNKYYSNIQLSVFNPLMAEIMNDIRINNLHYEGEPYSYIESLNRVKQYNSYYQNLITICVFSSHLFVWMVYFLIIPLIDKRRRTPAMMMMKVERVNFYNLNHTSRPRYLLYAFYSLLSTMILIMFIPTLYVEINTLFSYTFLLFGTVVGLVFSLASFIFIMFNQYNRSLVDYLSSNLYLTEEDVDAIYRARGYKI